MRAFSLARAMIVSVLLVTAPASAGKPANAAVGAPDAEIVIAAERAFAARHKSVSVKEAFQEFSADDGVAVTPEGVQNIKTFLGSWPDQANAGFIEWWPTMAGIAQSGDLGFTTGPASYDKGARFGDYFTVWKRQADGSWKWLIDLGTRPHKEAPDDQEAVFVVPASTVAAMDAKTAWADLQQVDATLAAMSATAPDAAKIYAAEVRLLGYQPKPVSGLNGARPVLAARAADLRLDMQGGGVSDAGDLGYTYGVARWTDGGQPQRGPFLRVWQRRAEGWKIVVENVGPF